jgi:hypothetical protein
MVMCVREVALYTHTRWVRRFCMRKSLISDSSLVSDEPHIAAFTVAVRNMQGTLVHYSVHLVVSLRKHVAGTGHVCTQCLGTGTTVV